MEDYAFNRNVSGEHRKPTERRRGASAARRVDKLENSQKHRRFLPFRGMNPARFEAHLAADQHQQHLSKRRSRHFAGAVQHQQSVGKQQPLSPARAREYRYALPCIRAGRGCFLPRVRANTGVGKTPTFFGAELFFMAQEADTLPNVRSLEEERTCALLNAPTPSFEHGSFPMVERITDRFLS